MFNQIVVLGRMASYAVALDGLGDAILIEPQKLLPNSFTHKLRHGAITPLFDQALDPL